MHKKVSYNRTIYQIITIIIPILIFFLFILKDYILELFNYLPACLFYNRYHLYCPGCGNTRSVTALLGGDVGSALRYNITPVIVFILCVCAYLELAFYSFSRPIRILPRNDRFYLIGSIILIIYLVIRNFIPYLTP